MNEELKVAVVVLSGGQDSATCLGLALNSDFEKIYAIGFDYGQKHKVELQCAHDICDKYGIEFTVHTIPSLSILADSALTTDGETDQQHHRDASLPSTFVPNRNALFLTIAHAYAQKVGAKHILTGVCQTDYSGYPDCRRNFIDALQLTLNLGYNTNIQIVTPLMYLTKAETFQLADDNDFLETVINETHTCYNGNHTDFHDWGYGCGTCPACQLRAKGYFQFVGVGT